jgi:Kef-type K+ transport system membrane component KefB
MMVTFQVALLLAAAKVLGWVCEQIRVPGVIGELLAGAIVGPFLLGSLIKVPVHGQWVPLFPRPTAAGQWPVNDVIWSMAQFASVVLLFVTGLHTDLKQFLRYVGPASLIALAGLVVPFGLGAGVVYLPGFAELAKAGPGETVLVPALFVGAILAATSIGITARVLGDIGRLETPEGVTILGAAVLDDVMGIIALAVVGGIATAGAVSFGTVGVVAGKAFGFWIGLTVVIFVLARPIEWVLTRMKYGGTMLGLALALAFLGSGAAEGFGLAFIIGAYSVGLGLSQTQMAHKLMDELRPVSDFVVPVFFGALGMLVNFEVMFADGHVVMFGLVVTAAAIVGKLVGCGSAAYVGGFNLRGSYRVGLGMMPRGEVALIVAGIGLSRGLIGENVFGVSILMTLLTTVIAPILLVPAFRKGGSGRKRPEGDVGMPSKSEAPGVVVRLPGDLGEVVLNRLLALAERRGWSAVFDQAAEEIYVLRSGADAAQVRLADGELRIDASDVRQGEFVGMVGEVRKGLRREVEEVGVSDAGGIDKEPSRG